MVGPQEKRTQKRLEGDSGILKESGDTSPSQEGGKDIAAGRPRKGKLFFSGQEDEPVGPMAHSGSSPPSRQWDPC